LGLSCTAAGLSLAGVPLLHKTEAGFVPRPAPEIASLIKAAYGADPTRLQSSLDVIAQALNGEDLARAMIAAVLTRTPELSWEAAARLANAEEKLGKYDADEPRDWHGRWTTDDAAASASVAAPVGDGAADFGPDPTRPRVSGPERDGDDGNALLRPASFTVSDGETAGAGSREPTLSDPEQDDDRDALLRPASFTISDGEAVGEAVGADAREPSSPNEAFEKKYDDLGPVDFAKCVIEFGDRLGREGRNLSPDEREQALAEYSFLQDRLSFWLAYEYKPPQAQANLLSAALTLYQGAVNGGIARPGDLPQSMVDVAGAAWGVDNIPPRLRPSTKPNFEVEPVAPVRAPKEPEEPEGLGGTVSNEKVGIVWGKGVKEQSGRWEGYVEDQNPDATGLPPTSKAFDHFIENTGEALSDKTLNTLSVSYIRYPQRILGRLKRYVDAAANYEPRVEADLDPAMIQSKTIHLAIPQYTSPTQWQYLNLAIRYAREHGVSLVITRISE
jgi:hypothetical protein